MQNSLGPYTYTVLMKMISGSAMRLYISLVLFPQVLWLLVSENLGLSVVCDNCSLLPPYALQHQRKPSNEACHQESGADNLTTKLCSCSVDSGRTKASSVDREGERDVQQDLMKVDSLGGW